MSVTAYDESQAAKLSEPQGWIRHWPFLLYVALAFGIPIALVASMLATPGFWNWLHGGPLDYWTEFTAIKEGLGLADLPASSLYLWVRVALVDPIFLTGLVYAAAPLIAGLIVAAASGVNGGLRGYARRARISNGVGLRETLGWYAAAFALVGACNLLTPLLAGWPAQPLSHYTAAAFPLMLLSGMFLDQGGTLEEGGWRGFALPYLSRFIDSPLKLNILLGVIWSVWHIPRDIAGSTDMQNYLVDALLPFTLISIGLGTIIAFFFYRVGGSLWIGIMIHCLSNNTAAVGWSQTMFAHQQVSSFLWTRAAIYIGIVIAIRLYFGKDMGLRRNSEGKPQV